MVQKPTIDKNSAPTNGDPGYIIPMAITGCISPAEWARELFKPSNRKSCSLENNMFTFGCPVFYWCLHN